MHLTPSITNKLNIGIKQGNDRVDKSRKKLRSRACLKAGNCVPIEAS